MRQVEMYPDRLGHASMRVLPSAGHRVESHGICAEWVVNYQSEIDICLDTHLICFNLKPTRVLRAVGSDCAREVALPPDSFSVIAAGTTVSSVSLAPDNEYIFFTFTPGFIRQAGVESSACEPPEVRTRLSQTEPRARLLGLLAKSFFSEGQTGGRVYAESLATMVAQHLANPTCQDNRLTARVTDASARRRIQRAIDYVHANLQKELTLAEVAEAAAMSLYHFARRFKQATGQSPHKFIMQCRLEHAQRLLLSSEHSIGEIALLSGFSSQSHLTSRFARHFSHTPRQYRQCEGVSDNVARA